MMEANELLELEYMLAEKKRGLLLAAAVLVGAYQMANLTFDFDDCVNDAFGLYNRIEKRMEKL